MLVATAIDTMVEALLIHIDDTFEESSAADCQSGIAVYDSLSVSQRLGLLHQVARHLLTPTAVPMELSASVEAAVAAIYVEIRDQVAIEIDLFPDERLSGSGQPTWRRRVLDAQQQLFGVPEAQWQTEPRAVLSADCQPGCVAWPEATCTEIGRWELLIDGLCDAVLWDRDFELAETFMDVDPGVSRQRRRLLGIEDDYFTAVPPDPRPGEVLHLVWMTRQIVRAKPR
jgi:hypothetical protein